MCTFLPVEKLYLIIVLIWERILSITNNLMFQSVTGSTTLFTALLKKSLERDVYPLCRYIPGKNMVPRFVALVPQVNVW